jgi:hypothetical protein
MRWDGMHVKRQCSNEREMEMRVGSWGRKEGRKLNAAVGQSMMSARKEKKEKIPSLYSIKSCCRCGLVTSSPFSLHPDKEQQLMHETYDGVAHSLYKTQQTTSIIVTSLHFFILLYSKYLRIFYPSRRVLSIQ